MPLLDHGMLISTVNTQRSLTHSYDKTITLDQSLYYSRSIMIGPRQHIGFCQYCLVWSASTHLTEYSLASFFILKLVLARI